MSAGINIAKAATLFMILERLAEIVPINAICVLTPLVKLERLELINSTDPDRTKPLLMINTRATVITNGKKTNNHKNNKTGKKDGMKKHTSQKNQKDKTTNKNNAGNKTNEKNNGAD